MIKKKFLSITFFIILIIFLLIITHTPMNNSFEYNVDEGTDLMKSVLFQNGFSLYQNIWSDQPPIFTVILASWLNIFGASVFNGRILVLIFSIIFLWSFFQTIKIENGMFCSTIAVSFLILSNMFLRLSVSIMIGIPALSLAMLSILSITLYKNNNRKYLLVLSGIFMALSLHTKLFTAFLIPIIIYTITAANDFKKGQYLKNLASSLFLWSLSFSSVYLGILIIFFHFNFIEIFQQLILPHSQKIIIPGSDFSIITNMLSSDYDFFVLSLFGIILVLKQKNNKYLFPVLWLGLATLVLIRHRPIWDHYYLLISIPICWLAAIAFTYFSQNLINPGSFYKKSEKTNNKIINFLISILLILTICFIPIKYHRMIKSISIKTTHKQKDILTTLSKHKKNTHWIFTDQPIFAFYSNMIVPPELALISPKRTFNNSSNSKYLITKLQEYKPELILIKKKDFFSPKLFAYLKNQYLQFPITESIAFSNKSFIWMSRYIYWSPRWFRFLNKIWCYKLPVLKGGYYIYTAKKEDIDSITFYIRKDIL